MDTNTSNFSLNKVQYTAFIAKWKALHAAKHPVTASEYFLFQLFTSDLAIVDQKIAASFAPTTNRNKLNSGSHPKAGLRAAAHDLLYQVRYNKSRIADLVHPGLLSEEQFKLIEEKTLAIYKGSN